MRDVKLFARPIKEAAAAGVICYDILISGASGQKVLIGFLTKMPRGWSFDIRVEGIEMSDCGLSSFNVALLKIRKMVESAM